MLGDSYPTLSIANLLLTHPLFRTMTISQAKYKGVESVPVSSEAMAVLFYENCTTVDPNKTDDDGKPLNFKGKWYEYMDLTQDCSITKKIPTAKKEDPHGRYQGRYSSSKSGSSQFGGWSDAGLRRFKELQTIIAGTRALEHAHDVEENIRVNLCKVYGTATAADDDDEGGKPKAKNKESEVDLELDFGDDDDDEEDEE